MDSDFVRKVIRNNIGKLTRHQIKTLNGQINKGDAVGAYKGLNKILRRYGGC